MKIREEVEKGLLEVEVEGKGRGVVASQPFAAGDFLCPYGGELISDAEARKRENYYSTNSACYMYFKSDKVWYV